jgi:hypothetical protein
MDANHWFCMDERHDIPCDFIQCSVCISDCNGPVLRCTSDDPNNHQGDTCPVHEA